MRGKERKIKQPRERCSDKEKDKAIEGKNEGK
jgi:hypothetical protein